MQGSLIPDTTDSTEQTQWDPNCCFVRHPVSMRGLCCVPSGHVSSHSAVCCVLWISQSYLRLQSECILMRWFLDFCILLCKNCTLDENIFMSSWRAWYCCFVIPVRIITLMCMAVWNHRGSCHWEVSWGKTGFNAIRPVTRTLWLLGRS